MNERGPYRNNKFEHSKESYQRRISYDNRSFSHNDRDNFYNQEKDYSFSSGRNCSLNVDREHNDYSFRNQVNYTNQSYSGQDRYDNPNLPSRERNVFTQKRDSSFIPRVNDRFNKNSATNQDGLYSSSQTTEYSSGSDRGNYSKQNVVYRSCSQSGNDNHYNKERDSFFNSARKHSYDADRSYVTNRDGLYSSYQSQQRDFSNEHMQYSTQDNSGLKSKQNVMCSPSTSKNSMYEDQAFYRSRPNSFSNEGHYHSFSQEDGTEYGQLKREKLSAGNKSSNCGNTYKRFKQENNYEQNVWGCNELEVKVEKDEVGDDSGSEIFGQIDSETKSEIEEGDDDYMNDEVCERSDNDQIYNKVNRFEPDEELIQKYKYFPPSAEEMGKLFNDLVIYFFFKRKVIQESNPFVIICESFRKSDRFDPLKVEDGYQIGNPTTKFCTLRWKGMMMVRGVGYTGIFKEPRLVAAVELINQLAMSCYSLKMKEDYFGKNALVNIIENNAYSNIVRIVEPHEVPDLESAHQFIFDFLKDHKEHELVFKELPFVRQLKSWATRKGYDVRFENNLSLLGVSVFHSPQYWRDQMLASGKMENEKFILIPPQGYGHNLMDTTPSFKSMTHLKIVKSKGRESTGNGPKTVYADKDKGLRISSCVAPWERPIGGKRSIQRRKKIERMNRAIQSGRPVNQKQFYKCLSKKNKKKFKKQLGI